MAGNGRGRPGPGAGPRVFLVGALFVAVGGLTILGIGAVAFAIFVGSRCACAATPTLRDPDWTPTPPPLFSLADAATRASKLAGVKLPATGEWVTLDGQPLAESTAGGVVAYVDGNSGAVLEIVFADRLPDSESTTITAERATAAAEAFLSAGGARVEGRIAKASLVHQASVSYYDVTWIAYSSAVVAVGTAVASADIGKADIELLVNATTGAVFVYRDLQSGATLSVPIVGHHAAILLAEQSSHAGGQAADPDQGGFEELTPGLDGAWTWMVGFQDGILIVDATTGEVTVGKWSSR